MSSPYYYEPECPCPPPGWSKEPAATTPTATTPTPGGAGSGRIPSDCTDCLSSLCVIKDGSGRVVGITFENADGALINVPECGVSPPPGDCGCNCCIPYGGYYARYTFTAAGVVDVDCDHCNDLNGPWTLKYRGGCVWSTDETVDFTDCDPPDDPGVYPTWELINLTPLAPTCLWYLRPGLFRGTTPALIGLGGYSADFGASVCVGPLDMAGGIGIGDRLCDFPGGVTLTGVPGTFVPCPPP